MMLSQMLFAIVFECLSSCDAKVSFMPITDRSQSRYSFFQHSVILNDDIDIDNGFCR